MSIITFLTDFGTHDWFVASMKGVALGINPAAALVDITHDIDQGDITSAAFVLDMCRWTFPKSTVFVVVVDPGVGSERRAIALRAGGRSFVGPDNGVFSFIMADTEDCEIHQITNDDLFRKPVSATFHGRDIFTPVGAHLSHGVSLDAVGPLCTDPVVIERPTVVNTDTVIRGQVVYIDRFGNALTNIDRTVFNRLSSPPTIVEIATATMSLGTHYAQCPRGEALALLNSVGRLEIAVNGGSAAQRFGLHPGAEVIVK
ncbi:MAG: hypothetical protein GF344_03040 [Chitinivibrionales bacterium]|nr:hypothetical protein [Chitinivibrionales bacterium]MBD3356054.1 hypothetical protein [Chitinivibrionales bacterium]